MAHETVKREQPVEKLLRVFLVFRGTLPPFEGDFWRWIDDWLNDLRIEPTAWVVDGKPFGQVEDGFASAVVDLWPQVVKDLKAVDLRSKKAIIVTGHSKGAAASFLAASLLKGQDFKDVPGLKFVVVKVP